MKKEKTMILIASILLIIRGVLGSLLGIFAYIDSYTYSDHIFEIIILVYSIVALGIGITAISVSRKDETLINRKGLILTFAILSIFQTIVASVLLFIAYDGVSRMAKSNSAVPNAPNNTKPATKKEVVKEYVSPEKKKIDILAKLGVFLVVLSGIILSTSYNNLFSSDISKPIIMVVLFLIFRLLYRLFDQKIKIESSSKLYYILSYVFFVLIFISIGYFNIISYDLSFSGYYSNLMYAIVLLSLSFSIVSIKNKYGYKVLGEISFSLVILSIILVLDQFNFDRTQIMGILLIISLFIYMNKDRLNNCILNINDIMFALVGLVYLSTYIFSGEFKVFELIIGIFIIALLRQRIVMNDRFACATKYILPIFINLLIVSTITQASNSCSIGDASEIFITPQIFNYRMITIIVLLLGNYLFLRAKDKETIHSGLISSIVLILLETISLVNLEYSMLGVLASIVVFSYITVILTVAQKDFIKKTCLITQFISLLLLAISGVLFYKNNGINVSYDTFVNVFLIFVMILNRFEKKLFEEYKLIRPVYFTTVITLLLTCSIFVSQHNIAYNLLMLALLFIYRRYANIYESKKHVFNYLILACAFLNLSAIVITFTSTLITNLILLVSLLITAYYVSRQKYSSYFIFCLAYLPYVQALSEVTMGHEIFVILSRLPLIFITFVITRKILSMNRVGNLVVEIILLTIVFFSYIFEVELTLGLFTFVLALIMIYIGFKNEKYNSLFIVGIGATLLNIIVQLADFWVSVPLPVYLLVSGLAIIGYVTYKEINKNKVKEEPKKEKVIEENIDTKNNAINIVLLLITCSCILINHYNIRSEIKAKELKEIETKLVAKGIDINTIYYNEDSEYLYIVEGNHYDVETILREYVKDYDSIRYKSYHIKYVPSDKLQEIKDDYERIGYYDYSDEYDYLYEYHMGTQRSFYYSGPVKRDIRLGSVNFEVKNKIINYLNGANDYYSKYNTYTKLVYNVYDTNYLELYISNVKDNIVVVSTSEGNKRITQDGLYRFKDKYGEVTININDKQNNYNDPYQYYYEN